MSALTRRVPRPSAALVVAVIALFMALGGTSYAALKITGKNVENSTLTGADVKNKSLEEKELRPDTLTGSRINASTLGTVPNAANAQVEAKAADADTLGGLAPGAFMLSKERAYEANIPAATNFATGTTRATLTDLPAGTYLVMARLGYYNPGGIGEESCTLDVPGANDTATFSTGATLTEQVSLQEVVTSDSLFMATVHCTSDGSDDIDGNGSLIAIRLD